MTSSTDYPHTHASGRRTWRHVLYYGGFWLLLTLWLRLCMPETLMGWERHEMFRFAADYLSFFATRPYPILQYIQAFFTQFYLYPLLGAAVIAGLLTLGIGAWHRLSGRLWPGWVWVACMLPLLPYFNLLWVLTWLVLLGGGLLLSWMQSKGGRIGLMVALCLAIVFVLQENVILAVLFWAVLVGRHTHSGQQSLYHLVAGGVGAAIGLGLMAGFGYPLYYMQDLRLWALLSAKFPMLHAFPAQFFAAPNWMHFYLPTASLLLSVLPLATLLPEPSAKAAYHLGKLKLGKRRLRQIAGGLGLTFLLSVAGYLSLRYQMEDFYLVERLGSEGRWSEATEAAELAFFQRARPEAAGKRALFLHGQRQRARTVCGKLGLQPGPFPNATTETFMADMLKISLLASRQATNRLLAYNGSYYFPLLFPEKILDMPSSYLVARYYTQNGLYAEALHLLYDFVTMQRISTAVLEPLLWNSVVVGDYEPCRKFIRFFEQSLFHKDIAHRYTAYISDTAQTARRPEIAAARTRLSSRNHTVLAYLPDDNIYPRLLYEGDNAAVFEYALALCLVYKDHARILAEWPKIGRYYRQPPIHLQEAVLANFPPEQVDEAPANLNPGIKARYMAFMQAYGLYQNGYISFKKLQKEFEDTYWYHVSFNEIRTWPEVSAGNDNRP